MELEYIESELLPIMDNESIYEIVHAMHNRIKITYEYEIQIGNIFKVLIKLHLISNHFQ